MPAFDHSSRFPASAEDLYAWHARPGAFGRLLPPWQEVELTSRPAALAEGTTTRFKLKKGPLKFPWSAEHRAVEPGRRFIDVQVRGPFRRWVHSHEFEDEPGGFSRLVDRIDYRLPAGFLGRLAAGAVVRRDLASTFRYRHRILADDIDLHRRFADRPRLRVAITGASGLIGSALADLLTTGGHHVVRLSRTPASGEIRFDPERDVFDVRQMPVVDAVVHLAGESIGNARWSDRQKDRIARSRILGTRLLVSGLAAMRQPPRALVCASAIGLYGDRPGVTLDESSPPGEGFLSNLCFAWEAEAMGAAELGIRTVPARFGIVLSPRGGALAKLLTTFRLGLGGRIGSGEQVVSWISIEDATAAILHCLLEDSWSGPINVTAPNPVTNQQLSCCLASVVRRPALLPLPAFGARAAMGQMADELLLASAEVRPRRLIEGGFHFRHREIETALRELLGRESGRGGNDRSLRRNGTEG